MKIEIMNIILEFIKQSENYDEEYIHKAIVCLAQKYPNLTLDEKTEIEAIATAYKVMTLEDDEEVEEEYEEELDSSYDESQSPYKTYGASEYETPKKGILGLFKR